MHPLFSFVVLAVLSASSLAKQSSPKVQVYSRKPGEFGKENVLICHASDFHPPDISLDLLKNGILMSNTKQTDLAFEQGWKFHLTKTVPFNPSAHDVYTCRVRHMTDEKTYTWEPDM
ncbi:beta-2-microglobulin, like [Electrophorus electricus]|uniref:Beta-2-microglobulin n=1 Tax=Electrophorus electricus TaxID=8005 RepID=A0A4W4DSI3_ELEEL|nr:beta-2-microglobulin, like [Electrophorus electricus]